MATDTAIRKELGRLMDATVADEASYRLWTYWDGRGQTPEPSWHPGQAVTSDCSKYVQRVARWAGLDAAYDPMGNGWGPYGNSQTLCAHLPHLDHVSQLLTGDVVTFGWNGNEHAAWVRKPDPVDPLLCADGHQGAPAFNLLSVDRRPRQLLRLRLPHHPPTHDDMLRAETGYWAWLQWALGEGDWVDRGKANRGLRPDVPTVPPPAWRAARAHFLMNRQKGNPSRPAKP